jgi:hypothetical protein
MHQVNLSDQLFAEAQRAATARGLDSVEDYIVELVAEDLLDDDADHLFTAEVLLEIDKGLEDLKAGRILSMDQVKAHFAKKRSAWRKDQAS